jgi:hypothetical protein
MTEENIVEGASDRWLEYKLHILRFRVGIPIHMYINWTKFSLITCFKFRYALKFPK